MMKRAVIRESCLPAVLLLCFQRAYAHYVTPPFTHLDIYDRLLFILFTLVVYACYAYYDITTLHIVCLHNIHYYILILLLLFTTYAAAIGILPGYILWLYSVIYMMPLLLAIYISLLLLRHTLSLHFIIIYHYALRHYCFTPRHYCWFHIMPPLFRHGYTQRAIRRLHIIRLHAEPPLLVIIHYISRDTPHII